MYVVYYKITPGVITSLSFRTFKFKYSRIIIFFSSGLFYSLLIGMEPFGFILVYCSLTYTGIRGRYSGIGVSLYQTPSGSIKIIIHSLKINY